MQVLNDIAGHEVVTPINNMYCSTLHIVTTNTTITLPPNSTVFGFVVDGSFVVNGYTYMQQEFFSIPVTDIQLFATASILTVLFVRHGYLGMKLCGAVEQEGRLQYIDGCTDSLLISPPRLGDACLNSLHFPPNTKQTMHTHPTIRMGVVSNGAGHVVMGDLTETKLVTGDAFIIEPHEPHCFKTTNDGMTVVAYHPDSDYGPTDSHHPMKNRTFI